MKYHAATLVMYLQHIEKQKTATVKCLRSLLRELI
jgi:hypothetical protein